MLVYAFAVAPLGLGHRLVSDLRSDLSSRTIDPAGDALVLVDALLAGNVAAARRRACGIWCCRRSRSATIPLAITAKITRSGMLEVLRADYIRTARAKGLGSAR